MASVTLTALRARVRELADMTGSAFVTDASTSLDAFINAAADELYDLLVLKFEDYNLSSSSFTTASGTGTYALPADFYKLRGVDLTIDGSQVALEQFSFRERHRYQSAEVTTPIGSVGTIWYIPTRSLLANGADTLAGVNGWEEYVVVDAAIRCLLKEESDASSLMAMKQGQMARIEQAAAVRDAGGPSRIVDVEGLPDGCALPSYRLEGNFIRLRPEP